jgi:hypothetical protein
MVSCCLLVDTLNWQQMGDDMGHFREAGDVLFLYLGAGHLWLSTIKLHEVFIFSV